MKKVLELKMKTDLWWGWNNKYLFASFTARRGAYAAGYGFSIEFYSMGALTIDFKVGKDMYFFGFGTRQKREYK